MSLYLQIAVGASLYLLDTAHIVEIHPDIRDVDGNLRWQDRAVPVVDLRELFAEPADAQGFCVLFVQGSGEPTGVPAALPAALIVDRVDGLVELAETELAPLPPIGPAGMLIDAVSTRVGETGLAEAAPANARAIEARPALRLRGERALAAAAAFG